MRHKMGIVKTFKLKQVTGMMNSVRMVKLKKRASDSRKENNSINFTYNMFADIYFVLHVCNKVMKLIHKITFSMQTFPSAGSSCIQSHLPSE